MVFTINYFPALVSDSMMITGMITTIVYLIFIEIVELKMDENETRIIFSALIASMIITFIFIVIHKISGVV